MNSVISDTSSGYVEDLKPSDSAEYDTTIWSHHIRDDEFQKLGSNVGVVQTTTLIPNIIRYCQLEPAYCAEWLNVFWEDCYAANYPIENESTIVSLGIALPESEKSLFDASRQTYLEEIYKLKNVKAIVFESIYNVKHFITVLKKRDLKTREIIYEVEMKIFDQYPNEQFKFSVYCIHNQQEIDLILKNKEILYYNI